MRSKSESAALQASVYSKGDGGAYLTRLRVLVVNAPGYLSAPILLTITQLLITSVKASKRNSKSSTPHPLALGHVLSFQGIKLADVWFHWTDY
jgi:hypothetical protein